MYKIHNHESCSNLQSFLSSTLKLRKLKKVPVMTGKEYNSVPPDHLNYALNS